MVMDSHEKAVLNHQQLADAKAALEYLRTIKHIDSSLMVDISRLYREVKGLWEPVQEAVDRIRDELGEGPEGARVVKQGTEAFRTFNLEVNKLLKKGEVVVTNRLFKPELVMKDRNPETGERETVDIPMSSADFDALEPMLIMETREEHAKKAPSSKSGDRQRKDAELKTA